MLALVIRIHVNFDILVDNPNWIAISNVHWHYSIQYTKAYLEHCQTFKIEHSMKILSILDVWQGSKYAFVMNNNANDDLFSVSFPKKFEYFSISEVIIFF